MAAGGAPTVPTADVQLQGAGATFPAPLYTSWFETYSGANPNIKIDYQAIGSGGGIKGITDQTVDFGASDAAMKDEEIAALKPGVKILHVPTALGAVVVIYNVPDATAINLDADTIAGLFAGHDQELERPEDRRAQLGRDPARPSRDRRPSLRRLRHDQRLHHLPRHRQRRLARQRRGGQGGPVADRHRRPGQ